ncbi:hypothetical protein ACM6SQ_006525, partial [Pseudomonas aeruginosa]
HPWKLFFKAYPTKSLSLPLYPTIFSLYPSGLSHSLSIYLASVSSHLPHSAPSATTQVNAETERQQLLNLVQSEGDTAP